MSMSGDAVDEGKLFVGGLSWETDEVKLKEYFSSYGEVKEVSVKKDKMSQKPRGFGFVTFTDPACAKMVLEQTEMHYLDGKKIEPKLALAKSESMVPTISENKENPNKVFIGGIPPLGKEFIDPALYQAAIDELKEEVKSALEQLAYPESVIVKDVEIKLDTASLKHKGFAFATFPTEDSARAVCNKQFFKLRGKDVEIKKAEPRPTKYNRAGGMGGGYQYHPPGGGYSHYDTSQTAAAAPYNPYYGSSYGYPQQQSSTNSYNSQPSTNTGSHGNYDNYPGYGGGSRGETAAASYGQTYPQSYSYGAGATGQGMQHGYPQASYGAQQHQQPQQSNYYQSHGMHHST
ncbi:uncharacterized protein LOC135330829 [Halichondria panicea]|uniref:uncharacterized protein LOC135330829 n=1 Tax=Halichondria panicea TaxID=6063 RepID=UPI00312B844F